MPRPAGVDTGLVDVRTARARQVLGQHEVPIALDQRAPQGEAREVLLPSRVKVRRAASPVVAARDVVDDPEVLRLKPPHPVLVEVRAALVHTHGGEPELLDLAPQPLREARVLGDGPGRT